MKPLPLKKFPQLATALAVTVAPVVQLPFGGVVAHMSISVPSGWITAMCASDPPAGRASAGMCALAGIPPLSVAITVADAPHVHERVARARVIDGVPVIVRARFLIAHRLGVPVQRARSRSRALEIRCHRWGFVRRRGWFHGELPQLYRCPSGCIRDAVGERGTAAVGRRGKRRKDRRIALATAVNRYGDDPPGAVTPAPLCTRRDGLRAGPTCEPPPPQARTQSAKSISSNAKRVPT